jgi:DNA polymerase (family 10)
VVTTNEKQSETAVGLKRLAIVAALQEIGLIFRLEEDPYRAAAYSNGADAIAEYEGDLAPLVEKHRLTEIKGVGKSVASVVEEVYTSGRSSLLARLTDKLPPGALTLFTVAGLKLSKIKRLNEELGVTSVDELLAAIKAGKLRTLRGFGEKSEKALLERISRQETPDSRILLVDALEVAEKIVDYLRAAPTAVRVDLAGAIRRWKETVSAIRITAMEENGSHQLIEYFLKLPLIAKIAHRDKNGARVSLIDGATVILSVSPAAEYWNVLHHETGSHAHLKKLEGIAKGKGIELSRSKMKLAGKRKVLAVESENDIYGHLDMQYVPPELREDYGEVEAALAGEIPDDLVTIMDIKGMTHCHTTYSDGRNTVEEMARAAEAMGMNYITITDHSPTAQYAGGLTLDRLKRQWDEISRVQEKVSIKLLRGTESDILRDGALDYPDNILEQFDVIIASIHNRYKLDEDQMTRRVVNAMKNPFFKIWGHPSGRLVQRRPPIACRIEEILDAIAESGAAIEISGDPHRLDMEPNWTREARKRGAKFVISTDAHSVSELENLRFGIGLARRAGVTRREVLNTQGAKAFQKAVNPIR